MLLCFEVETSVSQTEERDGEGFMCFLLFNNTGLSEILDGNNLKFQDQSSI